MPHAGHLIIGPWCRFHVATYVGNYLVSTVGEYVPDEPVREILAQSRGITLQGRGDARLADWQQRCGYQELGYQRLYETMVFVAAPNPEYPCCPWTAADWSEIAMRGYMEPNEAMDGHLELCREWAGKPIVVKEIA
jgi:hypothetical protein